MALPFTLQNKAAATSIYLSAATFSFTAACTALLWWNVYSPLPGFGGTLVGLPTTDTKAAWGPAKATINVPAAGTGTFQLPNVYLAAGTYIQLYIFSPNGPVINRYAANSNSETRLFPGYVSASDSNLAIMAGYSFAAWPSSTDAFTGIVNPVAAQPNGRLPVLSITYGFGGTYCPPPSPPASPPPRCRVRPGSGRYSGAPPGRA